MDVDLCLGAGLHLGCGLDARVYRIDPTATVDWYESAAGYERVTRIVRFRF